MISTELLLLFSFVSLFPVVLFAYRLIEAMKGAGAERVGVESRWGGIGGGGGGWGLTRPATWLLLTLFFSLVSIVFIGQLAISAQASEQRRDLLVLEINRRSLQSHQDAVEAMESARTEAEIAAAQAHLALAAREHAAALKSLETLWGASEAPSGSDDAKADEAKPAPKPPELQDINPRAVDP